MPSPRLFENGMLPGSAHTRRNPARAAPAAPAAASTASEACARMAAGFHTIDRSRGGVSGRVAPRNEAPGLRPGASQLNLSSPCSFDTERVQSSAHRNLVEVRRLGHGGCTDGAELVAEVEAR